MKKVLSLLLTLTLLLGMMPLVAFADGETITVNVEIEEDAFSRVRCKVAGGSYTDILNVNSNILQYEATVDVPVGSTLQLVSVVSSGVTFGGYYINGVLASTSISSTFTAGTHFQDGDTISILSMHDEFAPLAYDSEAVTLETRGGYPWTNTDGELASGNQGVNKASVLKVTALETGTLRFQYKTATNGGNGWLLYKVNAELTRDNYTTADNYSTWDAFTGTVDWTWLQFDVTAGDTIYFLHYKNGSNTGNETVWLREFAYAADGYTVTVAANDDSYGTVNAAATVEGEALSGTELTVPSETTVTFTATPASGYVFYGWAHNGAYVPTDSLTTNASTQTIYNTYAMTAVFGAADEFEARIDGVYYETLVGALAAAASGDVVDVVNDVEITNDMTIPAGVTLVIPYSANDGTVDMGPGEGESTMESLVHRIYGNCVRSTGTNSNITEPGTNVTYTVTVAENVTLTVPSGAVLSIGGVFSGSSQGVGGQVSGPHGEIVLGDGAQLVVNGGVLSCNGYITGDGTVSVTGGGELYENFVVTDFHGGTNFVSAMTMGAFPFNSYLVMGIRPHMTVDATASLYGYCTLPVGGEFLNLPAEVLGSDDALIHINNGYIETYYSEDPSYTVKGNSVGRTMIDVYGDATVGSMKLDLAGMQMDTNTFECPLPYSIVVTQKSGNLTIDSQILICPGNEIIVEDGAKLTISEDAVVKVLTTNLKQYLADTYYDGDLSRVTSTYPTPTQLSNASADYYPIGAFVVQGEVEVQEGATLAGLVVAVGDATVTTAPGANVNAQMVDITEEQYAEVPLQLVGEMMTAMNNGTLEVTTLTDGASYEYEDGGLTASFIVIFVDEDGETILADQQEVENGQTVVVPTPAPEKEGYTFAGWYNGDTEYVFTTPVTGPLTLTAHWEENAPTATLTLENFTNGTKGAATVEIVDASAGTFTVTCAYPCAVAINNGDGTWTKLKATAVTGETNKYSFAIGTEFDSSIEILVAIKGDLNRSGSITSGDYTMLKRLIAHTVTLEPVQLLAADVNADGSIKSGDYTMLKRVIAHTYTLKW